MVGIIILNFNTADYTIKCIHTIEETTNVPYKIYVVDNVSKDDSVEVLNKEISKYKDVELLLSDKNGGYSYGNNIGVKKAYEENCDKILIVNSDVELKENSIKEMCDTLDSDPDTVVVGPKVLTPLGGQQEVLAKGATYKEFVLSKQPIKFFYKLFTGKYFKKNIIEKILPDNAEKINGMVSGCCFMVKSSFFKSIGSFDENVFLYCEEEILYHEIAKANKKVIYNPNAIVVHKGSVSTGGWMSAFSRRCYSYSRLYYQVKYTDNFKGAKKAFAFWLTKVDYLLVSYMLKIVKKQKQNYKEQYKILKSELEKLSQR